MGIPMIDILLVLLIVMGRIPATPKAEPATAPQTPLQARTPQHVVILEVLRGTRGDKEFRITSRKCFGRICPYVWRRYAPAVRNA